MILTGDYHTHTKYSDGKNTVEENVAAAAARGLKEVAITEHGYAHWLQGISPKKTEEYVRRIRKAGENGGVRVLAGLECDLLGVSGKVDLTPEQYGFFDIFLMGMHVPVHYEHLRDYRFGWLSMPRKILHIPPSKSLVRYTTRAFVNAVEKNPVDIVTHLNYLCDTDVEEVAKCCRDCGTYLEISSKKGHFTDEELEKAAATGVRFVIDSDAHSAARVGDLKRAEKQILRVGIPPEQIDNIGGRLPNFRFAEYKKHL